MRFRQSQIWLVSAKTAIAALLLSACATEAPAPVGKLSPFSAVILSGPRLMTWNQIDALSWPRPQTAFRGYGTATRNALWLIYEEGGIEVYCRIPFDETDAANHVAGGRQIQWEHAFPAAHIADALGYNDRDCRDPRAGAKATCRAAVSDLHNLWPSISSVNGSRGKHPYAELEGDGTTNPEMVGYCPDFERATIDGQVYVEPTEASQGDLARALIYMNQVYGIPLEAAIDDPERLRYWHRDDPPDADERKRERDIRARQGSWNPLVLPAP